MPSYLPPRNRTTSHDHRLESESDEDQTHHVHVTSQNEDAIAELHRTVTKQSRKIAIDELDPAFADFEKYLRSDDQSGPQPIPLSVCFKSVTTYGQPGGAAGVKTLKDAIWRTLTFRDVYESVHKRVFSSKRVEDGQPLIRDFSGVVRNGQMML